MLEGGRFYTGFNRTMEAYFAQGDVKVFKYHRTRMQVTEIALADTKISVVRFPFPQIIPGLYGEILVQKGIEAIKFPIKRTAYEQPDFVVEEPSGEAGVVGRAFGNRLDLAIAYNLGVSDENLSQIAKGTIVQETIPERIAKIVLS